MNSNYWAESLVVMCSMCLKIGERSSLSFISYQNFDVAHRGVALSCSCPGQGCAQHSELFALWLQLPSPQAGAFSPKCAKPHTVYSGFYSFVVEWAWRKVWCSLCEEWVGFDIDHLLVLLLIYSFICLWYFLKWLKSEIDSLLLLNF